MAKHRQAQDKTKRWVETWLIDFNKASNETWHNGTPKPGEHIETVEIKRSYAPTRWARNHALTLRRKFQGIEITFSITAGP